MNAPDPRQTLAGQHEQVHLQLIGLEHAVGSAQTRADATGLVIDLLQAIGNHFGFEESVMQATGFPDFEHHLRQHLSIITELGLLLDTVGSAGDTASTARAAAFLQAWYSRHVEGADEAFLRWLDDLPRPA